MIGAIDMSLRGGRRDPGPGKTIGRPAGTTKAESEKRKAVSLSLQPDEIEALDALCAQMGLNRSDFVRYAMRHGAVLLALKQEA